MEEVYADYLGSEDKFLTDFVMFSKAKRKQFGVLKDKEYWPLEQLYNLLKRSKGGFILDIGQHACLGVTVKIIEPEGWFEVTYRDPFYADFKTMKVNSRTLETNEGYKVKVQWFGFFQFLESSGEQPGFTSLARFHYNLKLPKEHKKLIQKNSFLCGDISAYLASKSNISFVNQKRSY